MSTLKTNAIEPEGATTELSVGIPGQNVVIGGSGGLKSNVFKDAGDNRVRIFTTPGTTSWTCPTGVTSVEVLVVAGGGGGAGTEDGTCGSGGGGAGGYRTATGLSVTPGQSYTVTVGSGGAGGPASYGTQGADGVNSVFSSITSEGGGGGGTVPALANHQWIRVAGQWSQSRSCALCRHQSTQAGDDRICDRWRDSGSRWCGSGDGQTTHLCGDEWPTSVCQSGV